MREFRSICAAAISFGGRGSARCFSSSNALRQDISGVYPPITTPFSQGGQIDYGKLKENMKAWNSIDFAGYVVMGSNGEAASLKESEKLELVRNVKKMANPTSKILAGLGLPTTDQSIEICNLVAQEKTADAALIVAPSFYKVQMTDTVLRKFYEDVADKSKLPIIVYSVPANTNLDLSSSLVASLARHPNIIGLKDSGGDITKISEIVHNTPENFQVLAGSAGFLLPALLMGCVGGICALANVMEQVNQLYRLFQDSQLDSAIALQRRLIAPNLWVTKKLGVPGLKAAMDFKGLYGGPSRLPLMPIGDTEKENLLRIFEESGHPLRK